MTFITNGTTTFLVDHTTLSSINETNFTRSANFTDYSYDEFQCLNFGEKIAGLSDSFNKYPSYLRPLAMTLYICVACFGALGNLLVIAAVVRNPQMRIPRNYFIINLALSDFLMCTVTVPFTMVMILNTFWKLGSFTCKFVSTSQGVNTFVSTMSITAIGFDRYWVILFPTKTNQQRIVICICFAAIWTLSVVFALPLFSATDAIPVITRCNYELMICAEDWNSMALRQNVYSIGCIVFQYLLPISMLSFLYSRIIWRLKGRMLFNRQHSQYDDGRRRSVESRQRRMNILLICIVLIFAVSWLPLNIFNALVSFGSNYEVTTFAFCHIIGMTSACANPVLYGVFNDNFRTEFTIIFTKLKVIPFCQTVRIGCRKTFGIGTRETSPLNHNNRTTSMGDKSTVRRKELSVTTKLDNTLVTTSSPAKPKNGSPDVDTILVPRDLPFDTTVVSAPEETIPLCRNLIMNGLHTKNNFLLKTDLV